MPTKIVAAFFEPAGNYPAQYVAIDETGQTWCRRAAQGWWSKDGAPVGVKPPVPEGAQGAPPAEAMLQESAGALVPQVPLALVP